MATMTTTRPASTSSLKQAIIRHPLVAFFVLAFAGAWPPLMPMVLGRGEHGLGVLPVAVPDVLGLLLALLAAYAGPLLAAVLVTQATEGREGLRQLRRRIFRWRVSPRWYLVALFAPLTIWLATYSIVLEGLPFAELARNPMLLLTSFLPFVLFGLVMPSFGEEPGWRGFALPRLQQRHGPLLGTLVLGLLHGLWHLPMFFTSNLGPFTATTFTTFVLTGVAMTFIYTWVFNKTGGSVLLAILLHATGNAAAGLMNELVAPALPLDGLLGTLDKGGWIGAIAFGVVALVLVTVTRGRLGYRQAS